MEAGAAIRRACSAVNLRWHNKRIRHLPHEREQQTARRRETVQEIETTERVIDVRDIAPRHRHAIIFQLFDHLGPESSLQLIADHDRRPLRFQLEAKHGERCDWSYVEQGPDVWRVRLRHSRERPESI